MPRPMKIDFVSDVSCPWCIIGLRGLEEALARTGDLIAAEITFQPFELNPQMGKDGQNIGEHIAEKYGSTPEQSAVNRAMIRDRAADLGFEIATSDTSRIYNTFDAHRLLHWAQLEGRQAALKNALFQAYFTDQQDQWVLSGQVAPGCCELLARAHAPLQIQACQPFPLFPFVTRADPSGRHAVYPVPAEPKECGGPAVRARI